MIKAIACDMDGTLLNSAGQLTQSTIDTLVALQQRGILLILASGRSYHRLLPDAKKLRMAEFGGKLIDVNGTSIYDTTTKQRTYLGGMDEAKIAKVNAYFSQFVVEIDYTQDASLYVYLPDELYTLKHYIRSEMRLPADYPWASGQYSWLSDMRDGYPKQKLIRTIADAPTHCNKISIAQTPEQIQFVYQSLQLSPMNSQFEYVFPDARKFEITPKGIDKGAGLNRVLADAGIGPDEVAVFGDGGNDVPMFAGHHYSVAMGNALPVARSAANFTTTDNNHDGIVVWLTAHVS